jgi:citrate synthase
MPNTAANATIATPPTPDRSVLPPGLAGVEVADTAIGDVRGEAGSYHYRGYDAPRLAETRSFEEVWHLLLEGELPDEGEHAELMTRIAAARRSLPGDWLRSLVGRCQGDPVTAMRSAWSEAAHQLGLRPWLDLDAVTRRDQAVAVAAVAPVLAAATGRDVTAEVASLPASTAAAHLALQTGAAPHPGHVRALESYLTLTLDHGFNASTFTARVVSSTGADLGAVVVAALGALSGPLHGGAPSRVLDLLDAVGEPERAEPELRARLDRGERLMGFGHRVYRTEDPRAAALRRTAVALGGPRVELALEVERTARRLLAERSPDRVLDVNVEFHAAVVLEAVGLPRSAFTTTFAISRAVAWTAHALEQAATDRIVRPSSRYVGPSPRTVPTR